MNASAWRTWVLGARCLAVMVLLVGCAEQPLDARAPVIEPQEPNASPPDQLVAALRTARARISAAPPSFHGIHEYRSERETISHEVWVEWPAFRLS